MTDDERTEYDGCIKMVGLYTNTRRQDMTIVAAAQVAVLTIVAVDILSLEFYHYGLISLAIFISFMGLNADRRHFAYMGGYIKRALEIEENNRMNLLGKGWEMVVKEKNLISNSKVFKAYYYIIMSYWALVLLFNVLVLICPNIRNILGE